jgi:hypothetical protein
MASRASATALLLFCFAGAFRRSELAALDVADLDETDEGIRITIRRSKTDQEGHRHVIAIVRGGSICPVKGHCCSLQQASRSPIDHTCGATRSAMLNADMAAGASAPDCPVASPGRLGKITGWEVDTRLPGMTKRGDASAAAG